MADDILDQLTGITAAMGLSTTIPLEGDPIAYLLAQIEN
jgi:hypothetical protein